MLAAGAAETIDVVTACDDAYAQHAHVFLASMLRSNPAHRFRVFLLVPERFGHFDRLGQLEGYGNCDLRFVEVRPELVGDLPVSAHVTSATYFRLLIGQLLPPEVQRVVYFDSDIIVRGDLLPLWQTDLYGNVVGAVEDAQISANSEIARKVGLPKDAAYFNAGVMLIDLAKWRSQRVAHDALAFCRDNPERLTYWDQCALNRVLVGKVEPLNPLWNLQTRHLKLDDEDASDATLLADSKVIHFSASIKPWHYRCKHPLASMYWQILRETPWRDYVPSDRTAVNVLKRGLTTLLPKPVVRRLRSVVRRRQLVSP